MITFKINNFFYCSIFIINYKIWIIPMFLSFKFIPKINIRLILKSYTMLYKILFIIIFPA